MAPLIEETLGAGAPQGARTALFILLTSIIHDVNAIRGMLGEPEEVLSAHYWRDGMAQTSVTRFGGDVRVVMSWVSLPGVPLYEETVRFVSPEKRVKLTFPSPYLRHEPTALVIERMDGESLVAEQPSRLVRRGVQAGAVSLPRVHPRRGHAVARGRRRGGGHAVD